MTHIVFAGTRLHRTTVNGIGGSVRRWTSSRRFHGVFRRRRQRRMIFAGSDDDEEDEDHQRRRDGVPVAVASTKARPATGCRRRPLAVPAVHCVSDDPASVAVTHASRHHTEGPSWNRRLPIPKRSGSLSCRRPSHVHYTTDSRAHFDGDKTSRCNFLSSWTADPEMHLRLPTARRGVLCSVFLGATPINAPELLAVHASHARVDVTVSQAARHEQRFAVLFSTAIHAYLISFTSFRVRRCYVPL